MTIEEPRNDSSLATLVARQAIHDTLLRYCWGIDRGNLELVLSAFHDDAIDNHSGVEESAVGRFSRTVSENTAMRTSHNLGNVQIRIDGHKAGTQAYFTASHQFEFEGETWNWIVNGRYLDRFECRDGDWRIIHRTVVYDMERFERAIQGPAGHPAARFFDHVIRGRKSREDLSFQVLRH